MLVSTYLENYLERQAYRASTSRNYTKHIKQLGFMQLNIDLVFLCIALRESDCDLERVAFAPLLEYSPILLFRPAIIIQSVCSIKMLSPCKKYHSEKTS